MVGLVRAFPTEIQVNGPNPADSRAGDQLLPEGVTFANGQSIFLYEAPFAPPGGPPGGGIGTDEDINANLFDANFVRSAAVIGTPGFGFSALVDLNPEIAVLADVSGQPPSRALAVWQSGTSGIQERIVDSNGNTLTAALTLAAGATETTPDVAAFSGASGRSVVAWTSTIGGAHIVAETLNADGTTPLAGSLHNVSSLGLAAANPVVTTLNNGNYVVVWQDVDHTGVNPDPSGFGIHAKIFDVTGVQQGNEITVNVNTTSDQTLPTVAALSSGDFVVAWQDTSHLADAGQLADPSGSAIKARVFHFDGSAATGELTANTSTLGDQSNPSVAAAPGGNFVVAWTDASGNLDSSGTGIVAQAFNGSGGHIGSEFLVNQIVTGNQAHVDLSSRPDGSILATFEDSSQQAQGAQSPDTSGVGIQAEVLSLDVGSPPPPPPPPPPTTTSVERFFDSATGDHFYTLSPAEAAQIRATLPTYHDEGAPWSVPDPGPGTQNVYRFFDVITKAHFFTDSAAERDNVINTPSLAAEYHFEGVAFQDYTSAAPGTFALERFFNTISHMHTYGASAAENLSIRTGGAGPGWVDEGASFIVHT